MTDLFGFLFFPVQLFNVLWLPRWRIKLYIPDTPLGSLLRSLRPSKLTSKGREGTSSFALGRKKRKVGAYDSGRSELD